MSERALLCIVVSSVLLPILLGQACCVTPAPAPFDPLKVNDDIRNACADWGNPPDSILEAFLIGADGDRRAGVAELDEMAAALANCSTMGSSAAFCMACSTKVIQQVYSQ